MKIIASIVFACAMTTDAFTVVTPPRRDLSMTSHLTVARAAPNHHQDSPSPLLANGAARFFGVFGALSVLFLTAFPMESHASPSHAASPFTTNQIVIADSIKTLDMTLPSYGEIKAPTASVENVDSLTVAPSKGGTGIVAPAGKSKRAASKSKSDNSVVKAVLPSMNKQSAEDKAKSGEQYNF